MTITDNFDPNDIRRGQLIVIDENVWGVKWYQYPGDPNPQELPFSQPRTGAYRFIEYNLENAMAGKGPDVLFRVASNTMIGDFASAIDPQTTIKSTNDRVANGWSSFFEKVATPEILGNPVKFQQFLTMYYMPPIAKGDLPLSAVDDYVRLMMDYASYIKPGPGSDFARGTGPTGSMKY